MLLPTSRLINGQVNNGAISTPVSSQQKSGVENKVHTLVINVQNTPISIVKDNTKSFTKNIEGTHYDASFTRATSYNRAQHGTWLKNPTHLELKNRTDRSKVVGMEIKELKSLIKTSDNIAKKHCNNNSEHVIAQSVLCKRLSGIKANKDETQVSMEVRSIIVNTALAYQENKVLHENHTGTRWIIEKNNTNEDSTKFNTVDAENRLYFDDKGKVYSIVNGGIGKDIAEILEHEKQRVQFGKDVSNLLRSEYDTSSAIQLNQVEYANQSGFKETKENKSEDITNKVADYSFYHMAKSAERVVFANDDISRTISNDKQITLTAIDIDDVDRIELIASRLTMSLGRYPSTAEVKEVINMLDLNVPEHLSGLKGEITDADSETIFFKSIKHS